MAAAVVAGIAGARITLPAQAAVSVAAAPKAFTVVTVPVPEVLSAARSVAYRVIPTPSGTVLGSLRGTLPAERGAARTILLTIGVPANARPGTTTMATVVFEAGDRIVEVPVSVIVSAARHLTVHFVDSARLVPPGATVPLAVRLTNLGNAADSATLRVVAPTGWTVREPRDLTPMRLPAGGVTDRIATITAPATEAGTGMVRVIAESDGAVVATAEVAVTVSGRRSANVAAGPQLKTTVALVRGTTGTISPALNADVDGPVSDGVTVIARLSSRAAADAGAAYALAGAGVFAAPPSIELFSHEWRGRIGLSGTTCSELCGVNVTGRGGQFSAARGPWRAGMMAARPYAGLRRDDGALGFARVERHWSTGSWSLAYANLADRGSAARDLESLSLGAGMSGLAGGRFDLEVAQRRFGGSQGLGWSSAFTRRDQGGLFDFRYTYAPGGSRAFARATHDLAASVSRVVAGRLSFNGSIWNITDAAATFDRLTTNGWTMGGAVSLDPRVALSLTARGNGFSALTDAGGFGTREHSVEATAGIRRGPFSMSSAIAEGRLSRETTIDGSAFTTTSPRTMARGMAAVEGTAGALVLTGHVERAGAGAGLPPRQWSYGARLDRVPLASLGSGRLLAAAGAQRLRGLPGYRVPVAVSGALSLAFPRGERIELAMERNPFFYAPGQRGSAVFVLSATQLATLPRPVRSGVRGTVYKDLNGNGSRDAGEPGLPGVLVRRGTEAVMTDARGGYALGGTSVEHVTVDPRSLPAGSLAPSSRLNAGDRDIGLITVTSVQIRLRVIESDSERVAAADLAHVQVQARDAAGRIWLARHTGATTLAFDALPPGTYRLSVDASESREPLFVVGDVPDLVIEAGRAPETRTIVLRARPVRFGPSLPQRGAP